MADAQVVQTAKRKRRAGRRVLRVGAIIGLALLLLLTLLAVGVDVGAVGLITGLVLATVPAPFYIWVALRIDRFEPEPIRLLAWTFFWGASAATFIALVLNTAGQALVGHSFGSDVGEIYGGSVSAPIVEESAKAAVLFIIYRRRRNEINGILDGMVYAAMVGLGFAMTENILYYGHAAVEGGVPLAATFFFRGVMAPFTHPVFTCMTGIGLGIAAQSQRRATRLLAPAGGLLAAMLLHSLWNTSASVGGGAAFFGVFLLVMLPVFAALVTVVIVQVSREAKTIRASLTPYVDAGVLTGGDVIVLSALHERRRLRRAARKGGGRAAKRLVKRYMQAATELAFLNARATRSHEVTPADAEAALTGELRDLRARLPQQATAVSDAAAERAARVAAATQAALAAAPAWYPDPWHQANWRWWDGRVWTGYTG